MGLSQYASPFLHPSPRVRPTTLAVVAALLAAECIACVAIIKFIRYTEIDWSTYMQQAELYAAGVRKYDHIQGSTGPVVYPAGHLYAYRLLQRVTNEHVRPAQFIFAGLYIAAQALVMCLYVLSGAVPACVLPLLLVSKRLHSIYVLRLFNDAITSVLVYAACVSWVLWARGHQKRLTLVLGTLLFALALSVKMNVLLYVPAAAYILVTRVGLAGAALQLCILVAVQVVFACPFLRVDPHAYASRAFEFSRTFLWKWNVNWRWCSQDVFESVSFHRLLLVAHVVILLALGIRWLVQDARAANTSPLRAVKSVFTRPFSPCFPHISVERLLMMLFAANIAGILCARTLHFQFYSWYAQQIPFILLRGTPTFASLLGVAAVLLIELAWNVYPPAPLPSVIITSGSVLLLAKCFVEAWGIQGIQGVQSIQGKQGIHGPKEKSA